MRNVTMSSGSTLMIVPLGQGSTPALDLLPLERAKELAVEHILRAAKLRKRGPIYLLAEEINYDRKPTTMVRRAIENHGCNWGFWQNWGEG